MKTSKSQVFEHLIAPAFHMEASTDYESRISSRGSSVAKQFKFDLEQ